MYEVIVDIDIDINELELTEKIKYDKGLDDRYWNMRRRCVDKNNKDYKNYGGRGIQICEEWLLDKYSFFKWSYQNGYRPDLEIDRIDNNSGYSPTNCRYVSRKVNRANRRDSR